MPRIISFGEALIDLFAEPGVPLRAAQALRPQPGGAPANVAVALARLGADVGFIGRVGTDDFGAWLIDLLCREGVDTTHFVADRRAPTMLAVVAVPSVTEQQFVLFSGANTLLRPEDLDQAYIESADVLAYGSVSLAFASRQAALQSAWWARQAGHIVIFDVNLRPALWPDLDTARSRIDEGIASASVIKLNAVELEFLTGSRDPARGSRQLLAQGVKLCCVTLGAEGAYFDNGKACGHVPTFPVNVIDTTGSGDAFVAGLADGLARAGEPPEALSEEALRRTVRFANACGALAATRLGAMSALPRRAAVEELTQC